MGQSPGPGAYDVQDARALTVVAVTESEAGTLDRDGGRLADAVEAAAVAAGAGSAVAAALEEVRTRGEDVARSNDELVARAAAGARTAVAAYIGADHEMAGQYGPFPPFDPFRDLRGAPRPSDPLDPFSAITSPPRGRTGTGSSVRQGFRADPGPRGGP